MLGLTLLFATVVGASVLVIAVTADETGYQASKGHTAGWLGAVSSGIACLWFLWRTVSVRGPVITLTPDGLHDTRLTRGPIPWGDVAGVSLSQRGRQRLLTVDVSQAGLTWAELTSSGRWEYRWSVDRGDGGLRIHTVGLAIGPDDLLAAVGRYIADARGEAIREICSPGTGVAPVTQDP